MFSFRGLRAVTTARASYATRPFPNRKFHVSSAYQNDAFQHALASNKKWAAEMQKTHPDLLPTLSKGQAPPILWLGCADSRVPETTLLGLQPGDVFVHRNVANLIHTSDISMLSVVRYSIFHLGVRHVVLCGHTSCGGVAASLANDKLDVLDVWLQPIRELREMHAKELEGLDGATKGDFLAKASVRSGVAKLKRNPTVIDAMRDSGLKVHGVMYRLDTGLIEELDIEEGQEEAAKRIEAFKRA